MVWFIELFAVLNRFFTRSIALDIVAGFCFAVLTEHSLMHELRREDNAKWQFRLFREQKMTIPFEDDWLYSQALLSFWFSSSLHIAFVQFQEKRCSNTWNSTFLFTLIILCLMQPFLWQINVWKWQKQIQNLCEIFFVPRYLLALYGHQHQDIENARDLWDTSKCSWWCCFWCFWKSIDKCKNEMHVCT